MGGNSKQLNEFSVAQQHNEVVYANKKRARARNSALSLEEKIKIIETMRDDLEPLRRLRETNRANRLKTEKK